MEHGIYVYIRHTKHMTIFDVIDLRREHKTWVFAADLNEAVHNIWYPACRSSIIEQKPYYRHQGAPYYRHQGALSHTPTPESAFVVRAWCTARPSRTQP